ncbi:hypothetical protein SDC9_140940 [bioreactor metagenome]|uniref:Uncharacterized protein n=1 Tax=bioreactor metagenome TaxID=1076179 RepID=A0A645DXE0_9ZZZZ
MLCDKTRADSGTAPDPLVAGINLLGQIIIGHAVFRYGKSA